MQARAALQIFPARFVPLLAVMFASSIGCTTIRVTDPPRTATEQFLLSVAAAEAVEQLSAVPLRDRMVYIDWSYLTGAFPPTNEFAFVVGELRAMLLAQGVRLAHSRDQAEIILEIRSQGVGIDRYEFLLGIPALYLPSISPGDGGVPLATPELAIVKSTRQRGFASVAFVAYWRDTGELVYGSGPFLGTTRREDFWFFGVGPRTVGDIPPAQD